MDTTTVEWIGNRVRLDPISDTDLTVVQWWRPHNGCQRGSRVLDARELAMVGAVLEKLRRVRDTGGATGACGFLRPDLAGCPVVLEAVMDDLLKR